MNLLTDFNRKSIDLKSLANGNFILSSTTFNYCKHDFCHSPFPSPHCVRLEWIRGRHGWRAFHTVPFSRKTHSCFVNKRRREVYTWLEQSSALIRVSFLIFAERIP